MPVAPEGLAPSVTASRIFNCLQTVGGIGMASLLLVKWRPDVKQPGGAAARFGGFRQGREGKSLDSLPRDV
jgi:hypothetical protein